jgi:hypothetical protein
MGTGLYATAVKPGLHGLYRNRVPAGEPGVIPYLRGNVVASQKVPEAGPIKAVGTPSRFGCGKTLTVRNGG